MNLQVVNGTSIYTAPEFGSSANDHRARLRRALRDSIHAQHDETKRPHALETLTDLTTRPRLDGWALSISHCPPLGGFIAKPSSSFIGLDFEVAARVSEPAARRVAAFKGEPELLDALIGAGLPSAFFWTMKEAAIKAFGNREPLLTPHFGIIQILEIDFNRSSFVAAHSNARASGSFFMLTPEVVCAFAETS